MAKLKYAAGTRQAQREAPDTRSYYNFKGLFTKDEAGLIPQDAEHPDGVYASEIQNVVCKDGTIRPVGGYYKENDGGQDVTFATSTGTYFTGGKSYTLMDGTNRRVLFTNDGIVYVYNSTLRKYEILIDSVVVSPSNFSYSVYSNIQEIATMRDILFFASEFNGPDYWWNNAQSNFVSATANTITIGSNIRFGLTATSYVTNGGDLKVMLEGTEYTYTGKSGSTILTGVTPNPTLISHTVGASVMQSAAVNSAKLSNALGDTPDTFFNYKGRLGLANTQRSNFILSEVGDAFAYTDFTAGGAVAVNLGDGGGGTRAIIAVKDYMIAFKKDAILAVQITQESATKEYEKIGSIVYRENIGAVHKNAVCGGENEVYFISQDKLFKRIKGLNDGTTMPTCESVNNQIDKTLLGFEYDLMRIQYHENSVYITCRDGNTNDTIIEYDTIKDSYYVHRKSVSMFMVHNNLLHISTPHNLQTYVFSKGKDDVWDDDEGTVSSLWKSPRIRFSDMFSMKEITMFMAHLRISPITIVNTKIDFNYQGQLFSADFDIRGDGQANESGNYIVGSPALSSYGTNGYGIIPYGSTNMDINDEGLCDVLVYFPLPPKFKPNDVTVTFSSSDVGQEYSIIEFAFLQTPMLGIPKKRMISKNIN